MLTKIRSDDKNIDLLLQWSIVTDQPLGWRSVWLLRQILKKNDPILRPHIQKALDLFTTFNESQKREWLKLLENQDLDDDEEGFLFDHCINEWKRINYHPALRASAASILFKVLKKYPELKEELSHLMTSEYMESLSPGIKRITIRTWKDLETS
ncbi:MAG: hypothetical protein AAF391_01295 [Bacteroidota bacterium]